MRRRQDVNEEPADLMVFHGAQYRTEKAWKAAFSVFLADRKAWSADHDGAELPPLRVIGDCPVDMSRFRRSS